MPRRAAVPRAPVALAATLALAACSSRRAPPRVSREPAADGALAARRDAAEARSPAVDAGPPPLVARAISDAAAAVDAAQPPALRRPARGEVSLLLGAPRPVGDGRFTAVYLRGARDARSPAVVVEVTQGRPPSAAVVGQVELPTRGLWYALGAASDDDGAPTMRPEVAARTTGDLDGDGRAETSIVLRYETQPVCGPGSTTITQYFIVGFEPTARVDFELVTNTRPQGDTLPLLRGHVALRDLDGDGHADVAFRAQECDGLPGDPDVTTRPCRPASRQFLWDPARDAWLPGPAPAREAASAAPCTGG